MHVHTCVYAPKSITLTPNQLTDDATWWEKSMANQGVH